MTGIRQRVSPKNSCHCGGSKYRYASQCSTCYHNSRIGLRLGNYVSKTGLAVTGVKRSYRFINRQLKQERKPITQAYSAAMYLKARCRGYGITAADYVDLLVKQDYKCAICGKQPRKTFHIDHDRDTKKVRGLLCGNCNRALGYLRHNTVSLRKAIIYLSDDDDRREKLE